MDQPSLPSSKGAAAVPVSGGTLSTSLVEAPHLAVDKPLKDWTNAEVVEWAQKNCDDVVSVLVEKKYKGSILAGMKKEDFEKYLGGVIGAAFYNYLERAPLVPI